MIRPESHLSWSIVARYGGRKKPGRVSILTETKTGEVYIVPREVEHVDFVKELLGTEDEDAVRKRAETLIPSHIEIIINSATGREEVTSIHTGDSGLEIRYGVRHDEKALLDGHKRAKVFARQGEIPVSETLQETINTRYTPRQPQRI